MTNSRVPRTDLWDWQLRAACRALDVDLFYADTGSESEATIAAKRVCARCEVAPECLDHAIATKERWGIWGGLGPRERGYHMWAMRRRSKDRDRIA